MGELAINPLHNVYKQYRKVNLINPYISFSPYTDIDVKNFISATGISLVSQKDAVNYLITTLKSNAIWAKMQAVYPMIGSTAFTHKFNAKNPLDTDAAFRITFVNGTHSSNGWVGDPVLSFASGTTNLVPSAVQNVNSNGATLAIGADGTNVNSTDLTAGSTTTQRTHINVKSTDLFVIRINGTGSATYSNTDAKGVYTGQRISSTVQNGWKNGTKVINSSASGTLPATAIIIQGDKRFQSFYIHEGLSDSEVPVLRTIIDTYENMLGRKTW